MGKSKNVDIVTDWRQPDPLKLLKKNEQFSYRWIRKTEVELRKQQGWEIVNRDEVGLEKDLRISRGSASNAECNELILCKRPVQMGQAHRDYLDQKNQRLMEALGSQFHQEGQRSGITTYGGVKLVKKSD